MSPQHPAHADTLPAGAPSSISISDVRPRLEGGRYPTRRISGEWLGVTASVLHPEPLEARAAALFRHEHDETWQLVPMKPHGDGLWAAAFQLYAPGRYFYTVEAWVDEFATWRERLRRAAMAGRDTEAELASGAAMLRAAAKSAKGAVRLALQKAAARLADRDLGMARIHTALDGELAEQMAEHGPRGQHTAYEQELVVLVERERAAYGSWYQFFPRSCGPDERTHGTLRDAEQRLDDIARMGFNTVLLSPVHPVGTTNRKGREGQGAARAGDPGSPWAIGSPEGGHTSIDPRLGTLEDFERFTAAAREKGLEVAMEIALHASPDHPWIAEHPGWFLRRADGSPQPVDHPRQAFTDIVAFDFCGAEWRALWAALRDVFLFWCARGVRCFRVDHPHAKPLAFWEWVLAEVRGKHPDAVFLAESFTTPRLQEALAKAGFSQMLTYFPWRNTKQELVEFFADLRSDQKSEYFRPNLFPTTPDVLPEYLQAGGRAAFLVRAFLAATLGDSWGVYSGFELGENEAIPGTEEYAHSEKFELRPRRGPQRQGIREFITRLNAVRRDHPALQPGGVLSFHRTDNGSVLFYSRRTLDLRDVLLFVVNLDPRSVEAAWLEVPIDELHIPEDDVYQVHDLLGDIRLHWQGRYAQLLLDPRTLPCHAFLLRRRVRSERDFDYFG
ncbi:MAG: maltotransferase domain-containing protein [Candidatus Sumerlaeia bacterium]|nr:maltotransferase domain-containing protein [Candidatus Sumerlaeia bacterium]